MLPNQLEILVLPSVENIDAITSKLSVNITKAYYSSIEFIFKDRKVSILHKGRDISTFPVVWLSSYWGTRDLAFAVKQYLDSMEIPNTYVEPSSSKLTDIMSFALNYLPFPSTYFIENSEILNNIDTLEETCGYPLIMKDVKGCGGRNSALIKDRDELVEAVNSRDASKRYLFQEYIVNDYDWGVLVANNIVVSAERSYPQNGEFRNNAGNGAKEVFVEQSDIPDRIREIALKASKSLGLSWSRSDIIVDRDSGLPYLLEVNRFPGITAESTEVSGACEFLKTYIDLVTEEVDTSIPALVQLRPQCSAENLPCEKCLCHEA